MDLTLCLPRAPQGRTPTWVVDVFGSVFTFCFLSRALHVRREPGALYRPFRNTVTVFERIQDSFKYPGKDVRSALPTPVITLSQGPLIDASLLINST